MRQDKIQQTIAPVLMVEEQMQHAAPIWHAEIHGGPGFFARRAQRVLVLTNQRVLLLRQSRRARGTGLTVDWFAKLSELRRIGRPHYSPLYSVRLAHRDERLLCEFRLRNRKVGKLLSASVLPYSGTPAESAPGADSDSDNN